MSSSIRLPFRLQDPNVPHAEISLPQKHETKCPEHLLTASATKPISDDSIKIDVLYFRYGMCVLFFIIRLVFFAAFLSSYGKTCLQLNAL